MLLLSTKGEPSHFVQGITLHCLSAIEDYGSWNFVVWFVENQHDLLGLIPFGNVHSKFEIADS
jgi:hypothetical protein